MSSYYGFQEAIRNEGIEPPVEIIGDGNIHRFNTNGDKGKNCWYIFFPDEPAVGKFGCWKRGISQSWCSKAPRTFNNDEEKKQYQKKRELVKAQEDAKLLQVHENCRKLCLEKMEHSIDAADNHPYLIEKGVHSYGLKQIQEDLMVPLHIGKPIWCLDFNII